VVRRLPVVLSQEEVGRLIDSASNLLRRTMLMTLYSTGRRRAELCHLQVGDIDSPRQSDSYSSGQGRPRPRRAAHPETAGDVAGILALDEAQDLPVPGHGKELARGRPDQRQNPVARLPRSRPACRHHQTRLTAHAEAQLGDPPARSRHRSACDPDVAGPCQARRHRLVPASFAEAPDLRDQSIEAISFHSCRNRHCPKCQTNARDQWLAERSKELLPVSYVHVVFTLPHELSWLALQNKKVVYDLLFRTSAATLLEMAQDAEAESAT